MTLTAKTMEWLNNNRHRSYPMRRDEWREKVSPESGLDCVLLDAIAFNADAKGDEVLELVSVNILPESTIEIDGEVSVVPEHTIVSMKYAGKVFDVTLEGGDTSGEGSYEMSNAIISGGVRNISISLAFSSHAYIKETIGFGSWSFRCPVLRSRVINLANGFGMDGIATNGSANIDGHDSPSIATGDVVLEDGYRTSPVIYNGKVLVRVGKRYGFDPCKYDYGDDAMVDCRKPMFFFCGQNAVNSGNVVLKGGKGITVASGGTYTVRSDKSKCNGKTIPCIEIIAGKELLDIYRPHDDSSSSS